MDIILSPAKSPDPLALQNVHPPRPAFPSLLGHENPPSNDILKTFSPNLFLKK